MLAPHALPQGRCGLLAWRAIAAFFASHRRLLLVSTGARYLPGKLTLIQRSARPAGLVGKPLAVHGL